MGYTKIVQYGNVTEIYEYSKNLNKKQQQTHLKAQKLLCKEHTQTSHISSVKKTRQGNMCTLRAKTETSRSSQSLKKTRTNFFRLCHHNNVNSKSIHFITLTFAYDVSLKEAGSHLRRFMERVQKAQPEVPLRYISVIEQTQEGRYHYHLLVYDLCPEVAGYPVKSKKQAYATSTTERETRNLQVLFRVGYVDIVPATYTSRGIAGYMAKYMAKAHADERLTRKRVFNCSRNTLKIYSKGSNNLTKLTRLFIPTGNLIEDNKLSYNVPYMGVCTRHKLVKIIN